MPRFFPKRLAPAPAPVHFDSLPDWYRDNQHILLAYRPESNSCHACLQSLTYIHNESLNIYTHLFPALVLAFALPTLQINISSIYVEAPWMDRFILTLTQMAALLTLSLSATYHTMMKHSRFVSANCLLLDYTGILALILASFISGIYVGFYDSPAHQRVYFSIIAVLVLTSCLFVPHPKLQGPMYRPNRTAAFIATALSGFAPVVHACLYYGAYEALCYRGAMWWLAEGAWYGIGSWFFVKRWPECCTWAKEKDKGKFDLLRSSHQLFHCCVVTGAACHCWGVWWAWRCAV